MNSIPNGSFLMKRLWNGHPLNNSTGKISTKPSFDPRLPLGISGCQIPRNQDFFCIQYCIRSLAGLGIKKNRDYRANQALPTFSIMSSPFFYPERSEGSYVHRFPQSFSWFFQSGRSEAVILALSIFTASFNNLQHKKSAVQWWHHRPDHYFFWSLKWSIGKNSKIRATTLLMFLS